MGGLRTISRGTGYGSLSTISRGYLDGDETPPVDPGLGLSLFRTIKLSLQVWL